MSDLNDDEYCYVYLDFHEKLTHGIFGKKVFLRVANLHKPNPLVQLNDLVFKGTYDESTGTNLFFEEVEDPPLKTNIFEKDTPIHLKPVVTQTKIIKLKQAKLPRNATTANKQCKESVALNLNQDYNISLEKLEQGILNLEDLGQRIEQNSDENIEEIIYESNEQSYTEPKKEIDSYLGVVKGASPSSLLEFKYERLKRLARRPVKRMKEAEEVEECDPQYKDAYEYHNLERQVCQSSDYFRTLSGPIVDESFVGGIDLDRCVLHGLIRGDNDVNRVLTKEEQSKIFALTNLENLSIPARYLLLKECVSQIENLIETTVPEQVNEKDKDGKTIMDICNVFRRLTHALKRTMATENEDLAVREKLSERTDDEYVKYRHNPQNDILWEKYQTMFNTEEWIDCEDDKKEDNREESEDTNEDSESN